MPGIDLGKSAFLGILLHVSVNVCYEGEYRCVDHVTRKVRVYLLLHSYGTVCTAKLAYKTK